MEIILQGPSGRISPYEGDGHFAKMAGIRRYQQNFDPSGRDAFMRYGADHGAANSWPEAIRPVRNSLFGPQRMISAGTILPRGNASFSHKETIHQRRTKCRDLGTIQKEFPA